MEGVRYWNLLPCELEINDNRKVDRVEVFLNDELVHVFTDEPYSMGFNVSSFDEIPTTLKIVAYDEGGNWPADGRDISLCYDVLLGSNSTPGSAEGVFVSSSYAYVADRGSGLRIFDISGLP